MIYHATNTPRGISATRNMKSRLAIKFPTIKCPAPGKNSLLPGQEKTSNARGMPKGDVLASIWLCKWRKSRTMMVIIRCMTITKAKGTITLRLCHAFAFIWLKASNFKSSWPFNRGIKQNKITLWTARSWPRHRGSRWIEFLLQCIDEIFRGLWPLVNKW